MKLFGKKGDDDAPIRRQQQPLQPAERPSSNDLASRYTFRRNRTLTGSSSAQITSSNELNAELRSPRAHVHHLTSLRRRLLLYFSLVGLVAFGMYLLLSQIVASTTVAVKGTTLLPTADEVAYSHAIESYFGGRPTERLRFALNEPQLLRYLQSVRPEVKDVRVEPGAQLGEASIVITPRRPIARWSLAGTNQYVDGDGVVFSRNYFSEPGLQIVDNSGIQASSNRLVASNRFLGFVGRVISRSTASGLAVSKVTIPALTTRQIIVNLTGKTTDYKLSVDRSAGQQIEDIVHIDRYFTTHNMSPGYADVRIAGKVYYR